MAPTTNSVDTLKLCTAKNIAVLSLGYIFVTLAINYLRAPKIDKSLPWVGKYGPILGLTKMTKWIQEGYEKYSKRGLSFVLPGPLGIPPTIIIPSEQISWMLDQPDSILSTTEAQYDRLYCNYSFMDPELIRTNYHGHVVKRNLSRRLNKVIPDLLDEIIFNVDDVLGHDSDNWKSFNVWDVFISIIPRIINRVLVGQSMCRNQDFVNNMVRFTNDIVHIGIALTLTPMSMSFLLGPLIGQISKYHYRKTAKYTVPLAKQRLIDLAGKDGNNPQYKNFEEPEDYITWQIRTAQAENRHEELDPIKISQRIMPINFAAIHTTSITAHSIMLDILSTDPKLKVIEHLREEAERLWHEGNGTWTKESLSRMHRIDSVCRESMRVSGFAKVLVERKVVHPRGLTNVKEGWHAECGTTIACPIWEIQHDDDLIPGGNAAKFDAFRYSRDKEIWQSKPAEEKRDSQETLRLKQSGMVTTGSTHLSFSHGRHACPGRFFAAHELKMMVAYMVMNYDFKMIEERPQCSWIGKDIMPPMKARMEVRRRRRRGGGGGGGDGREFEMKEKFAR